MLLQGSGGLGEGAGHGHGRGALLTGRVHVLRKGIHAGGVGRRGLLLGVGRVLWVVLLVAVVLEG